MFPIKIPDLHLKSVLKPCFTTNRTYFWITALHHAISESHLEKVL